jgi:hypothetical protein
MRKLATLVPLAALALTAATVRPASARRGDCGAVCTLIAVPIAAGLAVGIVGGYAYGTGYYIVNDLEDEPHHASYYGTELFLHGSLATLFVGAARDELRAGRTGSAIGTGAFAALHVTLAMHGASGIWKERDEIQTPSATLLHWGLGTAYGINTLGWASAWPGDHGRGYGIAEVAVNAPITVGLGMMARERLHDDRGAGGAVLYSGMAAISAIYVAHGIKTLVVPRRRNKLDLLGTDVLPTVVSDGRDLAPGLGAAGSF